MYSTTLSQNGTGHGITDIRKNMLVTFQIFEIGFLIFFLIVFKIFTIQVEIIDEPTNTHLLNYMHDQVSLKAKLQNQLRGLQQLYHSFIKIRTHKMIQLK